MLTQIFDELLAAYGPQHWWPGNSPFEVMVGAILTQNTAWTNVEKAIANLKKQRYLAPQHILAIGEAALAECIRPAGYFNVKARRLTNFCRWYVEHGEYSALSAWTTHDLRLGLLSVNGVGPETADDILLYAFERPVFVIDAYTRRLFVRLGIVEDAWDYEMLRAHFEATLGGTDASDTALPALFNEYHALIVKHAKEACQKRPRCQQCVLTACCPSVKHNVEQSKTSTN